MKQNPDNSITVNQNSFANTIQPITIPKERLTNKETKVDQEEKKLLGGVIGQINLLAGITRPDISYDVCEASTKVKDATIADVLSVNKIVKKVKNELSEIHFPCLDPKAFISDVILMLASTIFQMVAAWEGMLFSCTTHQIDVVLLHGVSQR